MVVTKKLSPLYVTALGISITDLHTEADVTSTDFGSVPKDQ